MAQPPWKDWEEWRKLKQDFFAVDAVKRQSAVDKVRSKEIVPMEVEVTELLVTAELQAENEATDKRLVESAFAYALIRLTAAVKDNSEALKLDSKATLPSSITHLRNTCVHDAKKPSLRILTFIASHAKAFLKQHYWDYMDETFARMKSIAATLENEIFQSRNPRKRKLDEGNATDLGQLKTETLESVKNWLEEETLYELLLASVFPGPDWRQESEIVLSKLDQLGRIFSPQWRVHLTEMWLARVSANVINKADHVETDQRLGSWGEVIMSGLNVAAVDLTMDVRNAISVAIIDAGKSVGAFVPATAEQSETQKRIACTLRKMTDWIATYMELGDTKEFLRFCLEDALGKKL